MNNLIAVAPMMDLTDRHFRYLLRLITKTTVLYTEMVTAKAILHGNKTRLLHYHPSEQPVVLQLGGNNPKELSICAQIGADLGYAAINLNIGCPSDRVQAGQFGACLMAQPQLVAECVQQMQQNCRIPITVKTRIGIDNQDSYEFLLDFVDTVTNAGCQTFIIHARKAWLKGLNPKQNRTTPPICYDRVYQLKKDRPHLEIILNGNIQKQEEITHHLTKVDGVMLGRAAYENPLLFSNVDQKYFAADSPIKTAKQIIIEYFPYLEEEVKNGTPLSCITRHLVNLVKGCAGARSFRRLLSEHAQQLFAFKHSILTEIEQIL